MTGKYEYPPGDFVSGFGAKTSYELGCQTMVIAGCKWFDAHKLADPKFREFKNVFGIITPETPLGKELIDVMVKAADEKFPDGGVTGAMVHATVHHVLWIQQHSWEEYIVEMLKPREPEPEIPPERRAVPVEDP